MKITGNFNIIYKFEKKMFLQRTIKNSKCNEFSLFLINSTPRLHYKEVIHSRGENCMLQIKEAPAAALLQRREGVDGR